MSDELTFTASIAPLQSAITIASDGGARVKIDIPESEMDAVVRLMAMRERTLQITVAVAGKPTRKGKAKPATPEWGDDDGDEEAE